MEARRRAAGEVPLLQTPPDEIQMITPNRLTSARILLSLLVIYFLTTHTLSGLIAAFFAFIIAAITDYYDGHLARTRQMVTSLGKILDPIADKLLILSTYACYAFLGLFSIWWIVPMAVREVGITVLRFVLMGRGVVVGAERAGKLKLIAQLVSIGCCYAWLLGREYLWKHPAVLLDAQPLVITSAYFSIVIATAFTLYSGWSFLATNRGKF